MSIPLKIDDIFDIDEDVDMDISDSEPDIDNILDSILDASDGTGQAWEVVSDDTEEESGGETVKTYHFPVNGYAEWIKNLEKSGLSYNRHDRRIKRGAKKTNEWTERWYCHRYGVYESVAGKDANKKPRLVQKESKKCGCKSYIFIVLPINSSTVVLKYYYKHHNHYPGRLSDLCTLPLSENIRQFVQQRALEGLDTFSIHKLMRFRAIELQNQVFFFNYLMIIYYFFLILIVYLTPTYLILFDVYFRVIQDISKIMTFDFVGKIF